MLDKKIIVNYTEIVHVFFMKKIIKLFFIFAVITSLSTEFSFVLASDETESSESEILGYKLESDPDTSTLFINCYDSSIGTGGGGNDSICKNYHVKKNNSKCEAIESTYQLLSKPVFACMTDEMRFCLKDSDCKSTSKTKCVIGINGSTQSFSDQFSDSDLATEEAFNTFGICAAVAGDATDNAITVVLCKVIGLITGGPGKVVCIIVVSVVGVMFFLGKVQWSLLLSVGGGVGFIFGSETIIGFITGSGGVVCRIY